MVIIDSIIFSRMCISFISPENSHMPVYREKSIHCIYCIRRTVHSDIHSWRM